MMELWREQKSCFTSSTWLNQIRGKVAAYFETVKDANYRLVALPPTRRTAIGGYPRVAIYDMLGEQPHNSNPVKQG